MSYNRLKFPLNEPFHNEEARAGEALVAVPTCFWSQLSPEQFRAQLAMYRRAYDKARREVAGNQSGDETSFQI